MKVIFLGKNITDFNMSFNKVPFSPQLIPMMDIKEVIPDFQKLNKTENCIVIHMKTDNKVAITSPVSTGFRNCLGTDKFVQYYNCLGLTALI